MSGFYTKFSSSQFFVRVEKPKASMTKPIEFDTARLRLRQWCVADRAPFATLNTDSRVMEFFPARLDRTASDAMAIRMQSLIEQRGWGFWAVEIKQRREFIGFVGLHTPAPELPFAPCVEIGWRLAYPYWGNGFATEAAEATLRVGFELLELPEIVSFTFVGNHRSRAVMTRLQMQETAETFEHPHVPEDSGLRTRCLYQLSRDDWLASADSEHQPRPT